ncbi:hypothetical protein WG66_013351 [Moniliophthora roreri]|nr:hypothetical protein WG66_013351 [Moniliophthora roreri]
MTIRPSRAMPRLSAVSDYCYLSEDYVPKYTIVDAPSSDYQSNYRFSIVIWVTATDNWLHDAIAYSFGPTIGSDRRRKLMNWSRTSIGSR